MLVQGILMVVLGLVMLAVSTDFRYMGQFPQYSGNHLRNAARNLAVFYKLQLLFLLLVVLSLLLA